MRTTFLACALLGAGCFTTSIRTGAPAGPQMYEDRQWFTIGGLVALSGPAGAECGAAGVSWAESKLDVIDVLLTIAVSAVGGLVGAAVCPLVDNPDKDQARVYGSCVAGTASLASFLFASRTVRYACIAGAPGLLPPQPLPVPPAPGR